MTEPAPSPDSNLLRQITACQNKVYAFALSLLGDPDAAADIQQETNLVIWDKADEARQVQNFNAWALKIAYYQIKNYRRRKQHSPLVFDTDVMELLAQDAARDTELLEDRLRALHQCLDTLPTRQRDLLDDRYRRGVSVQAIAQRLAKPANQIGVLLFRIRAELHKCVSRRLQEGNA